MDIRIEAKPPWWKNKFVTGGVFAGALYGSYRLFQIHPIFTVGIAVIPVNKYLEQRLKVPPVLSKLVSLVLFTAFMFISWWVAEITVICAAIALTMEFHDLSDLIAEYVRREREKKADPDVEEAVRRLKANPWEPGQQPSTT